jgi:hypothetical protein
MQVAAGVGVDGVKDGLEQVRHGRYTRRLPAEGVVASVGSSASVDQAGQTSPLPPAPKAPPHGTRLSGCGTLAARVAGGGSADE